MNQIYLAILMILLGISIAEGIDIQFKKNDIKELTMQRDIYKNAIQSQNNSIIKMQEDSEKRINIALKARSDALALKKKSDDQLIKLQLNMKKEIGTTCDSAMKYGAKKGQSLYRCYQSDCTSKS